MPSNRPRRNSKRPHRPNPGGVHAPLATTNIRQPICPPGSGRLASVILNKPTSHPTVYRKRIRNIIGKPDVGDWVSLYHQESDEVEPTLFGYGLFNPKSEIAVRVLRFTDQLPDDASSINCSTAPFSFEPKPCDWTKSPIVTA